MKVLVSVIGVALGLGAAYSQVGPIELPLRPDPIPGDYTVRVLGISQKEFQNTTAALTEALSDPAVLAISDQIDTLIVRRDELVKAAALKQHPELSDQIETIATTVSKRAGRTFKDEAKIKAANN
jgi:hypothetical protein